MKKICKYYNLGEHDRNKLKQNALDKANQYEANNVTKLLKEKFDEIME